jgi:hypothetical protein
MKLNNLREKFTHVLEIIDLPKGNPIYQYYPHRPTELTFKYKETDNLHTEVFTLVNPLQLRVGDCLFYNGQLPPQMAELAKGTTGHPIYGIIKRLDGTTLPQAVSKLVSNGQVTYVGSTLSA